MEGKSCKDALKNDRLYSTNEGGLYEILLNQLQNPKVERHSRAATLLDLLSRKVEASCNLFYTALKLYDSYLYEQLPSQRKPGNSLNGNEFNYANKQNPTKIEKECQALHKEDICRKKLKEDHLHFTNNGHLNEENLLQVTNELRNHRPPVLNRSEAEKFLNDGHELHLRVTDLLNGLVNKREEACGFFYAAYKKLNPLGYMELPSTIKEL